MKKINSLKKSKGEITIIYVLVILIALLFVLGYYKMTKERFALDEVQSVLDIAGVTSLQKVINQRMLKDEIYGLDPNNKTTLNSNPVLSGYAGEIKREYKRQLTFNPKIVSDYTINMQDVYFENSNYGRSQTAPQIILETVITVELNIGTGFDELVNNQKNYFSGKRNSSIMVESAGVKDDGKAELILRSVVRSTYE